MDVFRYVSPSGRIVVNDWLDALPDPRAAVKITMRINRLSEGNLGDCRPLRNGVWELRIDWGPGYRVYYAKVGKVCLLLLCGGDKRSQSADIDRALAFFEDYKRRMHRP